MDDTSPHPPTPHLALLMSFETKVKHFESIATRQLSCHGYLSLFELADLSCLDRTRWKRMPTSPQFNSFTIETGWKWLSPPGMSFLSITADSVWSQLVPATTEDDPWVSTNTLPCTFLSALTHYCNLQTGDFFIKAETRITSCKAHVVLTYNWRLIVLPDLFLIFLVDSPLTHQLTVTLLSPHFFEKKKKTNKLSSQFWHLSSANWDCSTSHIQ